MRGLKWRPRIGFVVLAILLTVMALPLVGLFFFRIYENQLIRQTEAELIGQGAAIAAIYAQALREAGLPPEKLGPEIAAAPDRSASADASQKYRPVEPSLDLAVDSELGPRPDSLPATPDPAFAAIGAGLSGVLAEMQRTTLAGFRLLDPSGTVIAGGGDVGRSFAAVEEVRAALAGSYASVLRKRVTDRPAPPLYSVSRGTGVRVFVALPVVVDGRVGGAIYLSRTPNNIVKHLYGERGKVVLAAISILGVDLADRLRFAAHDQPADARADRPHPCHRGRRSRRRSARWTAMARARWPSSPRHSSTWRASCRRAPTPSRPSPAMSRTS